MENKTIYGYTLLRKLGAGGMAEVWYAENSIGKVAAVKILSKKLSDEKNVVERFANEARVMVKLTHPNIRQVYDYGMIDDRPCIVMEYLEGEDLGTLIKEGTLFTQAQIIKWWNQVVSALMYTHQLGIVHRDIKPSNIFITKEGNVELLDFGIAKVADSYLSTLSGMSMGTPMYMSPEQVINSKRVDYKSDLYSLAVTFVHLLRGKSPYTSDLSVYSLYDRIVKEPLDVSGVPKDWQIFLKPYLSKKPEDRPVLMEFGASKVRTKEFEKQSSIDETFVNNVETKIEDKALSQENTKKAGGTTKGGVCANFSVNNNYKDTVQKVDTAKTVSKGVFVGIVVGVILLLGVGVLVFKQLDGRDEARKQLAILEYQRDSLAKEQAYKDSLHKVEQISEQSTNGILNGHEWIDLGLSVKWATCNIGSSQSSDYGYLFEWGVTSPKSTYKNNKTYNKQMTDITGNPDYDAATANWGNSWRVPTVLELKELLDKCKWERISQNGHKGFKITGPNGNSIFLPRAGSIQNPEKSIDRNWGNYWSSTPHMSNFGVAYALQCLTETNRDIDCSYGRDLGYSIRPVVNENINIKNRKSRESAQWAIQQANNENAKKEQEEQDARDMAASFKLTGNHYGYGYVDLGLSVNWATCNIGANNPWEEGNYYAWGEISPKTIYQGENSITYNKDIDDIAGNPQYDAANANWGGKWRLPTMDECVELKVKCTWIWTCIGYQVKGDNGNSIFLPFTGYITDSRYEGRDYVNLWSSTPVPADIFRSYNLFKCDYMWGASLERSLRYQGIPIRPVVK